MNKKLVSVIIPAYNSQELIGRCLDSVLSQTYNIVEIILINDGSTDNTLEIANQYKLKYDNIHIVTQENRGLSCARNIGIEKSSGEYILFIDSDDEIKSNAVEKCLEVFSDDVDSVWFRTVTKCDHDEALKTRYQKYINNIPVGKVYIDDELMYRLCVNAWNKMFRKENFEKFMLRFPDGLYYEDNAFHYNYFSIFRNSFMLEDELYVHYLRKNSIMGKTRNKEEGMGVHSIWLLASIYEFWTKNNLLNNRQDFFEKVFEKYIKIAIGNSRPYEKTRCMWEATKLLRKFNLQYTNSYLKSLYDGNIATSLDVLNNKIKELEKDNINLKTKNLKQLEAISLLQKENEALREKIGSF